MKKIFTLIAMALMTMSANAEIVASWDAGTATGNWSAVGTSAPDMAYSAKYNKNSTPVTVVTFASSIVKDGAWVAALKLEGEFKAGDVITIQPFTAMSTKDFTGVDPDNPDAGANPTKYGNILLYSSDVKQIADLTGSTAAAKTVTDGHEEEGTPKEFTYTLEADYTDLYFGRGGNTRINLMKLVIERKGTTGIQKIVELKANNGVMYNLAGQKVTEGYKGVAIMNGKKVVIK